MEKDILYRYSNTVIEGWLMMYIMADDVHRGHRGHELVNKRANKFQLTCNLFVCLLSLVNITIVYCSLK